MKSIYLFLLLFSFGYSQTLEANYKVSFGIFGEVGIAKAILHVRNDLSYEINMYAKSTGFAAFVSGGREEWFSSIGKVSSNGILIPQEYKKIVQRKKNLATFEHQKLVIKKDVNIYTFNHLEKKVTLFKEKSEDNTVVSVAEEELEYYAKNDLLSLFFNLKNLFHSEFQTQTLYAVGANKKDGRIDIEPIKNKKKLQKELSWKEGVYLKVTINDKIFSSQKGELLVNLNDASIAQNALLKDVLFFGDIRGKLIE